MATVHQNPPAVQPDDDTRDHGAFAVILSPSDRAYYLGYSLFDTEPDAQPPREYSFEESVEFYRGKLAARLKKEEYDAWFDRLYREQMEEIFTEPGEGWHDAERIEAVGCIEARKPFREE